MNIMTKRMKKSIAMGVILGIFCVVGAYIRSGRQLNVINIFSLWYNRLILGFIIGVPWESKEMKKSIIRGAIIGFIISFQFYIFTNFVDTVSFIAGIVYGIIIEVFLYLSKV
ncbi:hypothetical protein QUF55_05710 [Clostridiaceae bacterium HSG29]|nr:hypothetical protein [Clostridiaceae bacterium HSG29]